MIELFMKQKMFSFKDAFHIYDRDEQETFKVEGRFFSLGDSLQMTDSSGKTLVSIEQKLMSLLPRYACELFNGIYLITPFLRSDLTAELTSYIQQKDEQRQNIFLH